MEEPMSQAARTRTVGGILYPDFELLDLFGPLEMFGNLGPEVRIVTVAEEAGPVRSTPGPATVAEYSFADCPKLDLLLLPGGIGTLVQLGNEKLLTFLRERSRTAELTLSVCSGSAILAKAGVLDGRRATSNKVYFALARGQSDAVEWVEKARWVEDGPFVTSSGVSAGTDMALGVIERLFGRERAEAVALVTEYQWHSDAATDPFAAYLNQTQHAAAAVGASPLE
jgi:putative intracellular protease/amidase